MRRDFVVTRTLLVLGIITLGSTILLRTDITSRSAEQTRVQESPASLASDPSNWEKELSSPEIQSLWLERRLLLERLSQAYLDEPDSTRREALRRKLERLIRESEQEITELRRQQQGGKP